LGLTFAFSKGLLAFSLYLAFRRENWKERERERERESQRHSTDVPTCYLRKAFIDLVIGLFIFLILFY
jgi:hypothetical protein